jgi:hypothetical protein
MGLVRCFSKDACKILYDSVSSQMQQYISGDPVIVLQSKFADGNHEFDTQFELSESITLEAPKGSSGYLLGDAGNAVVLHQQLQGLTPLQASDKRLWVWLSHVRFLEYVRERHLADKEGEDLFQRIRARCFIEGTDSRALMRNSIARLWWGAELTHQRGARDPYELTRILFFRQEYVKNLLERNFGRSRRVLCDVLRFFEENPEYCRNGGGVTKKVVIGISKECYARGGYGLLDTMSKRALRRFLKEALDRVLGALEISVVPVNDSPDAPDDDFKDDESDAH